MAEVHPQLLEDCLELGSFLLSLTSFSFPAQCLKPLGKSG